MSSSIQAGHDAADAIRADGYAHDCAAFDHGVQAATDAANGDWGSAAVEAIHATGEAISAQADYYEANNVMMDASVEHIQSNYDSGGGMCSIL